MAEAIVTKTTEPLRIAEASSTAPGFGHANLGPVFDRLLPQVFSAIVDEGAKPGISVAWYEEPDADGSVVLHAGFTIADQPVRGRDGIRVVELPAVEVASTIHRGSMDSIEATYLALVSWIERSGFHLVGRSRELYHEWNDEDSSQCVTELQIPISR